MVMPCFVVIVLVVPMEEDKGSVREGLLLVVGALGSAGKGVQDDDGGGRDVVDLV